MSVAGDIMSSEREPKIFGQPQAIEEVNRSFWTGAVYFFLLFLKLMISRTSDVMPTAKDNNEIIIENVIITPTPFPGARNAPKNQGLTAYLCPGTPCRAIYRCYSAASDRSCQGFSAKMFGF